MGAVIEPLFRCFVDYAQRQATLAGSRRPAAKLDPPLLLALDEVRQIVRVPLDVWLADSAGKGVCIMAVAHGMGQLRDGWGEHGAATIWDTTNKIILPGVSDRAMLETVAEVCGTVAQHDGEHRVQVPACPPAFIRKLPTGRALILAANTSPVVVKVRPVWARLAARLRLAAAPPILDAYLEPEAEPQAPALDGSGLGGPHPAPGRGPGARRGTRPARPGPGRQPRRTTKGDRHTEHPQPGGPARAGAGPLARVNSRKSWRPPAAAGMPSRTRRWPRWPPRSGTSAARSASSNPWWTAPAWSSPRTPGPW